MLLHIMSFAGDIRRNDSAGRESYSAGFALPGIRLFGLRDADFEADAAHAGAVDEGGGSLFAEGLRFAAAAEDLVVGCEVGAGC